MFEVDFAAIDDPLLVVEDVVAGVLDQQSRDAQLRDREHLTSNVRCNRQPGSFQALVALFQ